MEELKAEIMKLRAGEVYMEVGVNEETLMLAHKLAHKLVNIYAVDTIDDPCIAGTYYLRGKSKDITDIWFEESDGALISLLLINKDFEKNYQIWKDYLAPHGVVLNGEISLININKTNSIGVLSLERSNC